MPYQNAFVKPPPASYASALTMDANPLPVDLALALKQHAAYATKLAELGLNVTILPADNAFPDSCFVQDVALAIDGSLIVTRPGAPSRQSEPEAMLEVLQSTGLPLKRIVAPGTLDGGDVMMTDDTIYVGLSSRTNKDGVAQLAKLVQRPVMGVPLPAGLHLLSSCSYLGNSRILATAACADLSELASFEQFVLPADENYSANVLVLGGDVLMPAGYPIAESMLQDAGLRTHALDMSEFEKRDGSVTCLSLLY